MKRFISLCLFLIFICPSAGLRAETLRIQDIESKQGIKAWIIEDKTVPVISIQFLFRGAGARNDPPDYQGLSRILSNTMDEGAGDLSSTEFQKQLSQNSISLSFSSSRDDFGGNVKTLTKYKDKAFNLLRLSLTAPRFDAEAVNRMIDANKSRIRDDLSDPEWMAGRIENDVIYQGHAYAQNAGGTLKTLSNITPEILKNKWAQDLTKDRLLISIVGDISIDEAKIMLDHVFGDLPDTTSHKSIEQKMISIDQVQTTALMKHDIPQTILSIIGPGVTHTDPDYYTAEVMNYIFGGGGFGSRLTETIRETKGLTYGIYSQFDELDYAHMFRISTSAQNKNIKSIIDGIWAEAQKMKSSQVSQTELNHAKSYLIGSTKLQLNSTDRIASMMLSFQKWNLPKNYLDIREKKILSVTASDIQRVAEKYLDPKKFSYIMVGNPEHINANKVYTNLPNAE